MRSFFNIIILTFIFAIAAIVQVKADASLNLALKDQLSLKNGTAKLIDVLDESRTSPEIIQKYGPLALEIEKGKSEIQASDILILLNRAGVNLDSINLLTSGRIKISSDSHDEVLALIKETVMKKINGSSSTLTPENLALQSVPPTLPERGSFNNLEVELKDVEGDASTKQVWVKYNGKAGEAVSTSFLKAVISTPTLALVALKNMNTGDVVTAYDFKEEKRVPSAENGTKILTTLGKGRWKVARSIRVGEVVSEGDLMTESLPNKGDVVTILMKDRRFQIRTQGRIKDILDNGASVLVENIDSKKELIGKPVSSSEVEIVY